MFRKTHLKKIRNFFLGKLGEKVGRIIKFKTAPVQFITEKAEWSIYMDGVNISREINQKAKNNIVQISNYPYIFSDKIVHFGSQYMWTDWENFVSKDNHYITSFFHGKHEDGEHISEHINKFIDSLPKLKKIVTASSLIEKRLLKWGVERKKLFRIPIGVDTKLFCPPTSEEKKEIRKQFGIPNEKVIIGSFQKDGVGWGDGEEPKFIKGPDLFIESVSYISKHLPVTVFLTGPARGYVKRELANRNIDYVHFYYNSIFEIAHSYKVLDLYLVTSREEGGPKGIVESMASGVPIVSTKVGMAEDFIIPDVNGEISNENSFEISEKALSLLNSPDLSDIVKRAREDVKIADWKNVAQLHWEKIYKPLLRL